MGWAVWQQDQKLLDVFQRAQDFYPEDSRSKNSVINCDGLSPLQKCTAAMRMLAYGTAAGQLDEVLMLGASTSLDCLSAFAQGINDVFGGEFCALLPLKNFFVLCK